MSGTGAVPRIVAEGFDAASLAAREVDVALRDGSTVHVRPVRDGDLPALRAFLGALPVTTAGCAGSPAR